MMLAPDAFLTDAYGWVTNQSGHALIGLVLTALVAWLLRLYTQEDMRGPALVLVVLGYFFGWEATWQTIWVAGPLDAVADTFFVAAGGYVGIALWERRGPLLAAAMAITGLGLALGAWRRRK